MNKKCINCGYFLNCDNASEEQNNCEKFVKAERIIRREKKIDVK